MRFGVREICNVVFKAATDRTIGSKTFKKGQPVLYFDSLKTSTLEQAVTTVYAQGGRGNSRLIAWDGEKTLTFTMEDALISEMGLAILASAKLFEADSTKGDTLLVHVSEVTSTGKVTKKPATTENTGIAFYALEMNASGDIIGEPITAEIAKTEGEPGKGYAITTGVEENKVYLIDYYTEVASGATQIDIEPQSFGGNFYIEADTLFRDTDGADHAAQFIIPNGKIQSNFTLSMASTGDPSTFTFTVDAFPGYVNGDLTKKVLSAIQILGEDTDVSVNDPAGDLEDSTPYDDESDT